MVRALALAVPAALFSGLTLGQVSQPSCGEGNLCPESAPCCSQYGQCGVGAYCLGGCDPKYSHTLDSCVIAPVCKSTTYDFNSLDGFQANTIYLGDAQKANWVAEGKPITYDNSVMLTMAPDTVGTLLSTTHYVWYGKVTARMKSSAGAGVVSAFILMSDVKDEIDFEFVGADLQHVQSNFYWQGVLDYHNSKNLSATNTDSDWHTYEIDWGYDSLTWSVDGQKLRTLKKSDTFNSTDNIYHYPQTPARVMLSLWPAGLAKNGKGTVDWAGGLIDWTNQQYMTNGFYHSQVAEIKVECYDPPAGATINGKNSYKYTNTKATQGDVELTNDVEILSSFYATGENSKVDPNASKTSSAGSAKTSAPSNDVATIPGVSGTGARGDDSAQSNSNSNSGSSDGSSANTNVIGGGSMNGQFSQGFSTGSSSTGSQTGDALSINQKAMKGSVFAVLVAIVGLCML